MTEAGKPPPATRHRPGCSDQVWQVAALTGHRSKYLTPAQRIWVRDNLRLAALHLRARHGTLIGISGMADGCDLWWADAVAGAGFNLWAHIPFPQQADPWSPELRREWTRLTEAAWKVTPYGQRPEVGLFKERDRGMVDAAREADGLLISVLRPGVTSGGTLYTTEYARGVDVPILNVDPEGQTVTLSQPRGHP